MSIPLFWHGSHMQELPGSCLVSKSNSVQRAILCFLIRKIKIFLGKIQVLLVDIMVGYNQVRGNIFVSKTLFLEIL
jgi:hypothetical protein